MFYWYYFDRIIMLRSYVLLFLKLRHKYSWGNYGTDFKMIYLYFTFRMDKSWMSMDRRSKDYEIGVERFIDFAMVHATNSNHILCPCMKCGNVKH